MLEESGNVQLAAELAGVGLGGIYRLRRVEAGFIGRMEAARATAAAGLAEKGRDAARSASSGCARARLPCKCGEDRDGLVIRRGIGGRLRVMAAGTRWWAARHDAIFLGHLRVTGNAAASARAAGFTKKAAYDRRERLPSFARAWEAALDEAANRLQGRLVHEVLKGSPEMMPDSPAQAAAAEAAEWEPFDPWLAIWLLKYWQRQGKLERTRPRQIGLGLP